MVNKNVNNVKCTRSLLQFARLEQILRSTMRKNPNARLCFI